jgi:DNA-binding NarL/FixJ family response regulator
MTTIVLADDHPVVRQGMRALLEAEPDFRVIGEAGDGLEAASLVERLQPDVLVLDLMMPGLSGLETARQVRQRAPRTRVVILSMHADESYVLEALRHGAVGYLLKTSNPTDLVLAVREVAAGRRYLGPPLSERAIEAYIEKTGETPLDPYETLTAREREVLHLSVLGHSNAAIADRLGISPRTVETHRAHVMDKLNLRNQADLIGYAIRRRIIVTEG